MSKKQKDVIMNEMLIEKIHKEFVETKKITLPEKFLPREKGYNLLNWAQELFTYYECNGIIVRPFDELPPLKLSLQQGNDITIRDVHKFIISDMNLVPIETRKSVLKTALLGTSSTQAWENISPVLVKLFKGFDEEAVTEELSWMFSPVSEILWALTLFFIEKERVVPPQGITLHSKRFPYYLWLGQNGEQVLWEPENNFCRWQWLAFDLYRKWQGK